MQSRIIMVIINGKKCMIKQFNAGHVRAIILHNTAHPAAERRLAGCMHCGLYVLQLFLSNIF